MSILVFFGVVILFSVTLNAIDKINSYNHTKDRSLWEEGDSVIIKHKKNPNVGGGFATRIDQKQENLNQ